MAKNDCKSRYDRTASEKEMAMIEDQQKKVLDVILEAMESKGLEWTQDWVDSGAALSPRNPYTGTVYRGMNAFNLGVIAWMNGWDDPRWATPRRIIQEAAKAKEERGEVWSFKGQKTSLVVKYKQVAVYEKDENGKYVLDEDGKRKVVGSFMRPMPPIRVLNMAQVEGAPKWEPPAMPDVVEVAEQADRLIETCVCPVSLSESHTGACFRPSANRIELPSRQAFSSLEGFTSTLAHEYVHATGTPAWLNRPMSGRFGSEWYAAEELVAELGSVLVCSQLGFGYRGVSDVANHAAYLKSWLKALKADDGAKALGRAFSQAQAACDLIMSRYRGDGEDAGAAGEAGKAEAVATAA